MTLASSRRLRSTKRLRFGLAGAVHLRLAPLAVLGVLGAAPPSARADDIYEADRAAALIEQGRALMDQGKRARACAKFRESLDEEDSWRGRLNLARCYESLGFTHSAARQYEMGARLAAQSDDPEVRRFEAEGLKWAEELDGKVGTIWVDAPPNAPESLSLECRSRDSEGSDCQGAFGVKERVNPGAYDITVTAPGYCPWATSVVVGPGQEQAVSVPPLEQAAKCCASQARLRKIASSSTDPGASPESYCLPREVWAPVTKQESKGLTAEAGAVIGTVGLGATAIGVAFAIGAAYDARWEPEPEENTNKHPPGQQLAQAAVAITAAGLFFGTLGIILVFAGASETPRAGDEQKHSVTMPQPALALGPEGGNLVLEWVF